WKHIARMIPALFLPVAAGYLLSKYFDLFNIKTFIASAIIYAFVYLASVWFTGMNNYEKQLITKPLNRVRKKIFK
ncbi:MAG: polysaccharide biosynthesis protein, partial [Bacteroidota bacterium]